MTSFSVRLKARYAAWLLLLTLTLLIVIASVWIAYSEGESIAREDATLLMDRSRIEAVNRTSELLEPTQSLIRVAASLGEGNPDFFRRSQGSDYLNAMLSNSAEVDRVYVAFADGSLRMSLRLHSDSRIGDAAPPNGAVWAHRWLERNGKNPAQDHYKFLDKQFRFMGELSELAVYDPRVQPWFKKTGDAALKLSISEPYILASTGRLGLTISMPFYSRERNEFIGKVAADVRLDSLSEFLALRRLSKNSVSVILDQEQRVIAHPDPTQSVLHEGGAKNAPTLKSIANDLPAFAMAQRPTGVESFTFKYGDDKAQHFARVSPLPTSLGKNWSILMVAPASDFSDKWGARNRQQVCYGLLLLLVEMLLIFALAKWIDRIRHEKDQTQKWAATLSAQEQFIKELKNSEAELEGQLALCTADLASSQAALKESLLLVESSNQQAENSRFEVIQAQGESTAVQAMLIQSEKMASLGQLISGVAHEINTPISAVKASGENIADALFQALSSMPKLFSKLDATSRQLFEELIAQALSRISLQSTREERNFTRESAAFLAANHVDDAAYKAGVLVQLNAQSRLPDFLPLLQHVEVDLILDTAHSIANIVSNAHNINTAVARVTKIVLALKSFAHSNIGEWVEFDLLSNIDTVLTILHSQIPQGVEMVCNFEEIAPIRCLPDELSQVWTNLIHNAMQAMAQGGTLTIDLRRVENQAVVTITDTGSGIPEAIRSKIFDVFFTTKPVGVGSGLGLDIVKKIIDKHQGRIEVQSEEGVGTTFAVYLPYSAVA